MNQLNSIAVANDVTYEVPTEEVEHEGTWLFWPHHYQFGVEHRNDIEPTWIAMTKALVNGENVHILVYNHTEKNRVMALLKAAAIPLSSVDFKIHQYDDVWARDSGPIYAYDNEGQLIIEDWGFNGWGKKYDFIDSNKVPTKIAEEQSRGVVDLNAVMVLEGGAVEVDGNGTMLLTKSAVLNNNRNANLAKNQAEAILRQYYGVSNFIWLDGVAGLDVTDMHIDGFAKFAQGNSIVTMSPEDLLEWDVPSKDIERLYDSKDKNGMPYRLVTLPLTKNNVRTSYGKKLGYKGSYVNYYVANGTVLVPNYHDPNDTVANAIVQGIYPDREVVGIDARNLLKNGGMIHCVTQQQPID